MRAAATLAILVIAIAAIGMAYHFSGHDNPAVLPTTTIHPRTIDLTEASVSEIERSSEEPSHQAEAKKVANGWEIIKVNDASAFAKTGLRTGDVVTIQFLNHVREKNVQLAERIEKIMGRITPTSDPAKSP